MNNFDAITMVSVAIVGVVAGLTATDMWTPFIITACVSGALVFAGWVVRVL